MQNKALLEHGKAENHKLRLQEMRNIQKDPNLRREFLLKQAMFASLNDAAAIQ